MRVAFVIQKNTSVGETFSILLKCFWNRTHDTSQTFIHFTFSLAVLKILFIISFQLKNLINQHSFRRCFCECWMIWFFNSIHHQVETFHFPMFWDYVKNFHPLNSTRHEKEIISVAIKKYFNVILPSWSFVSVLCAGVFLCAVFSLE